MQFNSQMTSLSKEELVDKVKGIIYGAAIGDGIGLATEFMQRKQAKILYGNGPIKFGNADGHEFWRDSFRGGWFENDFTDETDQQLLVLQCLLADNGTLNPVHLAYRIKEWCHIGFPELKDKFPRGIGLTVGSTCSHKDLLTDPLRASYDIWNARGRNLAANGALMRTGVVGAPFFWDERKVVENCMMAAKVTHADPRSVSSAVIVSVIISRLLRGDLKSSQQELRDSDNDNKYFTEMIQMGSTDDNSYMKKFSHYPFPSPKSQNSSLSSKILRQVRRAKAYYLAIQPAFEVNFQIPQHKPVNTKRLENPAPIRPNVKPMDEFGADKDMMKLCEDVVNKYKFLVEGHSLCPPPPEEDLEKSIENKTAAVKPITWVEELRQHCFPVSLSSLQLDEGPKIGYALKCLGAALYLGTRKKPEEMSSASFFEHLITELLLETGDADTNCAAAGAVLGCRLGKSGLPKPWVNGLRHKDFLENISNDLCSMIIESMKKETQRGMERCQDDTEGH